MRRESTTAQSPPKSETCIFSGLAQAQEPGSGIRSLKPVQPEASRVPSSPAGSRPISMPIFELKWKKSPDRRPSASAEAGAASRPRRIRNRNMCQHLHIMNAAPDREEVCSTTRFKNAALQPMSKRAASRNRTITSQRRLRTP